jgi:hypothetical protein
MFNLRPQKLLVLVVVQQFYMVLKDLVNNYCFSIEIITNYLLYFEIKYKKPKKLKMKIFKFIAYHLHFK